MLVNVIDIEVLLFRGNKSGGSYVTRKLIFNLIIKHFSFKVANIWKNYNLGSLTLNTICLKLFLICPYFVLT